MLLIKVNQTGFFGQSLLLEVITARVWSSHSWLTPTTLQIPVYVSEGWLHIHPWNRQEQRLHSCLWPSICDLRVWETKEQRLHSCVRPSTCFFARIMFDVLSADGFESFQSLTLKYKVHRIIPKVALWQMSPLKLHTSAEYIILSQCICLWKQSEGTLSLVCVAVKVTSFNSQTRL